MRGLSFFEKLLVFYGAHLPEHPRKWWIHHHLRRLSKGRVNQEFDVIRKGLKWRLNPSDYTDSSLFWLNSRDDWDLFHLKRLLKPGGTVFDVGANFGYYSLILATALNQQCRILACEPNPLNFQRLKKHVIDNEATSCVQLIPLGVSDRVETVCMQRPKENSGHATIDSNGEFKNIQLTTLNNLCNTQRIDRLDLLILDVEGYEQRVLQSSKEILHRFTPLVFVELFPPVMQRQGSRSEAVIDFLSSENYQLFIARKDRLIPLEAPIAEDSRENVFAFHKNHFSGDGSCPQ